MGLVGYFCGDCAMPDDGAPSKPRAAAVAAMNPRVMRMLSPVKWARLRTMPNAGAQRITIRILFHRNQGS
jgi:hypothetical protein